MKVTKNYLKRLIEEELKNMREGMPPEPPGLGMGGEPPAPSTDAEVTAEPLTAEDMLEKVHLDIGRWMEDAPGAEMGAPDDPALAE